MPRRAVGNLYFRAGSWYVAVSLDQRSTFRLASCKTESEARARRDVVVGIAQRLRQENKLAFAKALCKQAAAVHARDLPGILTLVDGVIAGVEQQAKASPSGAPTSLVKVEPNIPTVRELAELWTTNELARRHRRHVDEVDHRDNRYRLDKHVLGLAFRGKTIGDTHLDEFTLDHADHVLAQASLPEGSVRHVAQILHRLFRLAVYPARLIPTSPLPRGWLPKPNDEKERSYLYPSEDLALLQNKRVPLVQRLFVGFCAREGLRRSNAVMLEWGDLTLDFPDGTGAIALDTTKNGRGATWVLDSGTAEALRRWKRVCPSSAFVFPDRALPGRDQGPDRAIIVDHLSVQLRRWLKDSGVSRLKLYDRNEHRIPIRAHDLRATFVTLALAMGRSEAWVTQRTGHLSSAMVAKYTRAARTAEELNLGWLIPLHEAIPELHCASVTGHEGL